MINVREKKGFTLIELIIVFGIMSIVTALIFTFYCTNEKQLNIVQTKSDLQYEAKKVLDYMSKDAMEAISAQWDEPSKKLTFKLKNEAGGDYTTEYFFDRTNNFVFLNGEKICESFKEENIDISDSQKIRISLSFKKMDISYKVEENYTFRNRDLN